jgi:hypothetical protein
MAIGVSINTSITKWAHIVGGDKTHQYWVEASITVSKQVNTGRRLAVLAIETEQGRYCSRRSQVSKGTVDKHIWRLVTKSFQNRAGIICHQQPCGWQEVWMRHGRS